MFCQFYAGLPTYSLSGAILARKLNIWNVAVLLFSVHQLNPSTRYHFSLRGVGYNGGSIYFSMCGEGKDIDFKTGGLFVVSVNILYNAHFDIEGMFVVIVRGLLGNCCLYRLNILYI